MKKLFFLPVIFTVTLFAVSAQHVCVGFTAGTAFSNYHSTADGASNGSSKTGIVFRYVGSSQHRWLGNNY